MIIEALNFINQLNKVRIATEQIRRAMQRLLRATCPQLAQVTGLSLVTVHREIKGLEVCGEVKRVGEQVRGGRPSPVYEYEREYAARLYVQMMWDQGLTRVEIERWDMAGERQGGSLGRYVAVENESLDGRIEDLLENRRVYGVGIYSEPVLRRIGLCEHLSQRLHCPVEYLNAAAALAERAEGCATLYLARGEAPQGCIYRRGFFHEMGRLDLLTLPSSWNRVDYSDHTLVEEMVARLLQIITSVVTPGSITLYADFWSTRLTERIRFNTQSKLRGVAPSLRFGECSSRELQLALRRAVCRVGDNSFYPSFSSI